MNATPHNRDETPAAGIENSEVLEFVVFCILRQYIVPGYDVLHTRGREYVVEDILDAMKERGVLP